MTAPHDQSALAEEGVAEFYVSRQGMLVAESESEVVGFMLFLLVPRMHGIRNVLWVEHLSVVPEFRRQGVGLAMIRALQQAYTGRAAALHAAIHPLNTASLGLFRAAGAEISDRALAYCHFATQ